MQVICRSDDEGGFTAADMHNGITIYAPPGSPQAEAGRRPSHQWDTASHMLLMERDKRQRAEPLPLDLRRPADAVNMARLEAGRLDGSTRTFLTG
jgi:hypothetical protein